MNSPTTIPTPTQMGSNGKPSFHIAFCVDNNYFRAMGGTIASIIANNPEQHFTFHVLAFEVSEDHQRRLKQLEAMYPNQVGTQLHLLDLSSFTQFSHFLGHSHYSLSIFTRLVIPTVLQGQTDRVLYLDADILCVNKLDEMIDMDISQDIAVVVPDAPVTTQRRVAALGLQHPQYFNGGVLFINIPKWISEDITQQTLDALLTSKTDMRFNDQDALNIVLNGRARYVSPRWNYLYDLIHDLNVSKFAMRPVGKAVFIHFAGAVKPWTEWSGHDARHLFRNYLALSPWADMPLDPAPKNTKEMPIKSSHVLICRTDNIGDVILTLPMVARLKQHSPTTKISFFCRAYAAPVVRYCTDIDEVIAVEDLKTTLSDYLKNSDIDTVILAQPDQKLAVSAFRARIRHRIGNARQKLYLLFYCNRRVRFSKGQSDDHEAQINFNFLHPYGITDVPTREEIPSLYHFDIPTDPALAERLSAYDFNLICHTKSNGHGREWPIEYYKQLAEMLAATPKVHVWLTGSAAEGAWLIENAPQLLQLPNVINTCGTLTLAQLTALIHQADGLIASGTGPLHMSAAIGQRTLGLFPPTRPMHPGRWAALGKQSQNLCVETSCPDCRKLTTASCDCMRKITPESVRNVVEGWIQDKAGKVLR